MTVYYVYADKCDVKAKGSGERRRLYFVTDPADWVRRGEFKPEKIEFTGVTVEADDPETAKNAYLHPDSNPDVTIVSADEPKSTRPRHNTDWTDVRNNLTELGATMAAHKLGEIWQQLDETMRQMARFIAMRKSIPEEDAYQELKARWIERYKDY